MILVHIHVCHSLCRVLPVAVTIFSIPVVIAGLCPTAQHGTHLDALPGECLALVQLQLTRPARQKTTELALQQAAQGNGEEASIRGGAPLLTLSYALNPRI
jgi:hypothetical protein